MSDASEQRDRPPDVVRPKESSRSEGTSENACPRCGHREPFLRACLKYFTTSVLFVLVPGIPDCFGLRSETSALSQTLMIQALAPFYPQPGAEAPDVPPPITAITLDEAFLDHMNLTWPLSYGEYARLVRRLALHQPEAIFLDLLFTQARGSEQERRFFAAELSRARDNGTEVLIGAPNPCLTRAREGRHHIEVEPGRGLLPEMVRSARPVVTEWAGYDDLYPLLIDVRRFERAVDTGHRCVDAKGELWKTPALALFEIHCRKSGSRLCPLSERFDAALLRERFAEPMVVRWKAEVPVEATRLESIRDCNLVLPNPTQRVGWSLGVLGEQLRRGMMRAGDRSFEPCPATTTLHAASLFPTNGNGAWVRDPEYEDELGKLLRGRLVLVGTDLLGSGDSVFSPVHGQLPGVYLHAMALDNLFRFGDRYIRQPWHPHWRISPHTGLELLLAAGISAIIAMLHTWMSLRSHGAPPHFWRRLGLTLAMISGWALLAVVVFAGVGWLALRTNTSPANWLGLVTALSFPFFGVLAALWRGAFSESEEEAPVPVETRTQEATT